ncbi:hypothetical protein QU605_03280 [Robiginitalea sp. M39]|uniref:Uncharacterized protein n=2 Tax=Robiginitalea aurantiaca TaxID=3056915 RepID=A0ABT7WC47_9FLAO|nr:hypothetical protein [Robiginitalea aurantiaca]
MKVLFTLGTLFWMSSFVHSQELIVHHFNADRQEVETDTLFLGDLVVLGHAKKGKNPHYFQGKITGIFKDRQVVRVFDYARSTRVVPIAGKKIKIDEIIAVERLDEKEHRGRENRAIVATAGQFLGSSIGGTTGDVIFYGSTAGNIISDFVSRQKIKTDRIRCEIIDSEY